MGRGVMRSDFVRLRMLFGLDGWSSGVSTVPNTVECSGRQG
jgi:hypothetical protein